MRNIFLPQSAISERLATPLKAVANGEACEVIRWNVNALYAMRKDEVTTRLEDRYYGFFALAIYFAELLEDEYCDEYFLSLSPMMEAMDMEAADVTQLFEEYYLWATRAQETAAPNVVKRIREYPEMESKVRKKMKEQFVTREQQCAEAVMQEMINYPPNAGKDEIEKLYKRFKSWLDKLTKAKMGARPPTNRFDLDENNENCICNNDERQIFDELQRERFKADYDLVANLYEELTDNHIIDHARIKLDVFYFSLLRAKFVDWNFLIFQNSEAEPTLNQKLIFIQLIYQLEIVKATHPWAVAASLQLGQTFENGQHAFNKCQNKRIQNFKVLFLKSLKTRKTA